MESLFKRIGRRVRKELQESMPVVDTDVALQASMAACIEMAATRYALDPGAQYHPSAPLRLLLAGYSGTRNTGADVRVEEMIRQLRHLIGDEHLELSITTMDPELSKGYFRTVRQITLPQIFPKFVVDVVHEHHGVIACEGSMFKSKFANALATFMVGSLAVASVENKIAVGYGGEAGKMDPSLRTMVRRYCKDTLQICRNEESRTILEDLGVPTAPGTDTAWGFEPASPLVAEEILRSHGWDGQTKVVALCPINPFWWPVKPDVVRGAAHFVNGSFADAHYKSVYFHHSGSDVDHKQSVYLDAWASGIKQFMAKNKVFPVAIGMEKVDRLACEALAKRVPMPVIVSDEYDMHQMVSVLRRCRYLLSSRYHAIVCSMPGTVASAGVTMDERIRNLMKDRTTPELALTVDQPDLGPAIGATLQRLADDEEALREGIGRCVVSNLERMGQMGQILVDHLRERHPDLPLNPRFGSHGDPWEHLPPLSKAATELVARYGSEPLSPAIASVSS